ncbi:MAG: hypothetical protein RL404_803 [Pseudomonadota bacterium]|jgi:hypothetical protein
MPEGAEGLSAYVRYYAGGKKSGRLVLIGVFLSKSLVREPGKDQAPVRILSGENSLPAAFDGGCLVVNFSYDLNSGERPRLWCNGVA